MLIKRSMDSREQRRRLETQLRAACMMALSPKLNLKSRKRRMIWCALVLKTICSMSKVVVEYLLRISLRSLRDLAIWDLFNLMWAASRLVRISLILVVRSWVWDWSGVRFGWVLETLGLFLGLEFWGILLFGVWKVLVDYLECFYVIYSAYKWVFIGDLFGVKEIKICEIGDPNRVKSTSI